MHVANRHIEILYQYLIHDFKVLDNHSILWIVGLHSLIANVLKRLAEYISWEGWLLKTIIKDIVAEAVVFWYHKSKMAARIQDGWWYNCDIQSNKAMQGLIGSPF